MIMGKREWSLKKMQEIANNKGGRCLSEEYLGYSIPVSWECGDGHQWQSKLINVAIKNRWCPYCAPNRRLKIDDLKRKATENEGLCLSDKLKNGSQMLKYRCSQGHIWEASGYKIMQGRWCPQCAQNTPILFSEIKRNIKKRGGLLLSKSYSYKKKLSIKCANGHIFEKHYSKIKHRFEWCPVCNFKSFSEEICRELFFLFFNCEFDRAYPKWLNQLELDGFNANLKLAFEHQGIQHYDADVYTKMCKGKDSFEKLKERDALKRRLCKENGVILIEIPSIFNILGLDNVKGFLVNKFDENNLKHYSCYKDIQDICCMILKRKK